MGRFWAGQIAAKVKRNAMFWCNVQWCIQFCMFHLAVEIINPNTILLLTLKWQWTCLCKAVCGFIILKPRLLEQSNYAFVLPCVVLYLSVWSFARLSMVKQSLGINADLICINCHGISRSESIYLYTVILRKVRGFILLLVLVLQLYVFRIGCHANLTTRWSKHLWYRKQQ